VEGIARIVKVGRRNLASAAGRYSRLPWSRIQTWTPIFQKIRAAVDPTFRLASNEPRCHRRARVRAARAVVGTGNATSKNQGRPADSRSTVDAASSRCCTDFGIKTVIVAKYISWFRDIGLATTAQGGRQKVEAWGELHRAGINVPAGFVVPPPRRF